MTLTKTICGKALALGFDIVGVAPAHPVPYADAYADWIAQGYHGEMAYLARPDRVLRRREPDAVLPGIRSVICVGLNYFPGNTSGGPTTTPLQGHVSRYAWGVDYHDLLQPRLEELAGYAVEVCGGAHHRAYVDTGPVLERAYAATAGLGFIGKNTNLIHPRIGSWLFLAEVLVSAELEPTPGKPAINCGTCTRCLDACPTGALIAPYVLDARRCISYLTIELKGAIPRHLRPSMGNWIYGCDVCQEVCPWQRFAIRTRESTLLAAEARDAMPLLAELARMDEMSFERAYATSPIARIGRTRLLRNVAVALGNCGSEEAVVPLTHLLSDAQPLVRAHAAWALGRTGSTTSLEQALRGEKDAQVREEIQLALGRGPDPRQ